MDLTFGTEQERFRAEARAWLAAHVPPETLPSPSTGKGFAAHRAWEATLHADRWSAVSWPIQYGGRGAGITEGLIFEEEYQWARAPGRLSAMGIFLLAPALLEFGTAWQKERFLPPMASGDEIWCQGWAEPAAGSDLEGIRSHAVRNAPSGIWHLTGRKTSARHAMFAEWCFGIFRTDPQAERHQGLTLFLVAMDSPGVTVQSAPQIDGRNDLADIFFDDVEVPDAYVLGEVGAGWAVATSGALDERGLSLSSPARHAEAAARLTALFDQHGSPAASADAVARAYIDAEASRLHSYWSATVAQGGAAGPQAACNQIFWSKMDLAIHETALMLLGAEAELLEAGSPGAWVDGYLLALTGSIYAGTAEDQHDIVAERLLGLPKD